MKIRDMFGRSRPVISFEFFPPKTEKGNEALSRAIAELKPLAPSFVSVTYGAGGSTRSRTIEWVARIKRDYGIEAMAHLTCVEQTRDEIQSVLERLVGEGIENVLALRGDPPAGAERFVPVEGGFAYANELVEFIRDRFDVCIGAACYPEGHVEAQSLEEDLRNLVRKVAAGVDFLVTQLFFDNEDYFRFVERARRAGVDVPIVPGIMPITDAQQVRRFTQMCGASIPDRLSERLEACGGDRQRVERVGVEHALEQCRGLLDGGAPGIHFYTLNKSPATRRILGELKRAGLA